MPTYKHSSDAGFNQWVRNSMSDVEHLDVLRDNPDLDWGRRMITTMEAYCPDGNCPGYLKQDGIYLRCTVCRRQWPDKAPEDWIREQQEKEGPDGANPSRTYRD